MCDVSLEEFALLSSKVYLMPQNGRKFCTWTECANHTEDGFKVTAYRCRYRHITVFAFRGTDNWPNILYGLTAVQRELAGEPQNTEYSDIETYCLSETTGFFDSPRNCERFQSAFQNMYLFMNELMKRKVGRTYLTGHSLGGHLAQLFAVKFKLSGRTFNTPGIGSVALGFDPDYMNKRQNYTMAFENHTIRGDFVNRLNGSYLGKVVEHESVLSSVPLDGLSLQEKLDIWSKLHCIDNFHKQLEKSRCSSLVVTRCTCLIVPLGYYDINSG